MAAIGADLPLLRRRMNAEKCPEADLYLDAASIGGSR